MTDQKQTAFERWWEEQQRFPHKPGYKQLTRFAWNAGGYMNERVAILFARRDSVYKQMGGVDVYDVDRDALTFPGGIAVVAHPPCRAWGGLRHMAKPRPGEKDLGPWAVRQVREWGGVLEHPARSSLWGECRLPCGSTERDEYGGLDVRGAAMVVGSSGGEADMVLYRRNRAARPAGGAVPPWGGGVCDAVFASMQIPAPNAAQFAGAYAAIIGCMVGQNRQTLGTAKGDMTAPQSFQHRARYRRLLRRIVWAMLPLALF